MTSSCYDEGSSLQQGSNKRCLFTTINTAQSLAETIRWCSLQTQYKLPERKREGININPGYFVSKSALLDLLTEAFFSQANCCLCAMKECYSVSFHSFWIHVNWFTISWKVYLKVAARRKLRAFISPTIRNCEPCTWNMPLKWRGMLFIFMFDTAAAGHISQSKHWWPLIELPFSRLWADRLCLLCVSTQYRPFPPECDHLALFVTRVLI